MKTLNFKLLAIVITSSLLITGCNKDDEKNVSDFVGNFVISEGKLAEVLVVPTNESGDFNIPVGTVITQGIQTALLSAVSCSSADKSYVELREDNSLYLSCEGSNPLNAGTWEEVSAAILRLNMNSTAIPPAGFVLTVSDIVKEASGLSGVTSVPFPKDMVAAIVAQMQKTLSATAQPVYIVKISIKFIRK